MVNILFCTGLHVIARFLNHQQYPYSSKFLGYDTSWHLILALPTPRSTILTVGGFPIPAKWQGIFLQTWRNLLESWITIKHYIPSLKLTATAPENGCMHSMSRPNLLILLEAHHCSGVEADNSFEFIPRKPETITWEVEAFKNQLSKTTHDLCFLRIYGVDEWICDSVLMYLSFCSCTMEN